MVNAREESRRTGLLLRERLQQGDRKKDEAKNLARLKEIEAQAKTYADSGDFKKAGQTYSEAIGFIMSHGNGNQEFLAAAQRDFAAMQAARGSANKL